VSRAGVPLYFRRYERGTVADRRECVGDAKWFLKKAADYARERHVFGRPIGQNQGIQFPLAKAYAQMRAAN